MYDASFSFYTVLYDQNLSSKPVNAFVFRKVDNSYDVTITILISSNLLVVEIFSKSSFWIFVD